MSVMWCLAAVALLSSVGVVQCQQPHILVIMADDLGWNDIGYHGSEIRTPVLDELAAGGVRLERYYNAIMCTPSRAMFLTGRHMTQTGLYDYLDNGEPVGLPLGIPTLAEGLRTAGYSTNLIGKWHLGSHEEGYMPTRRGFDYFYGFLNGGISYNDHEVCRYYDLAGHISCGRDMYDGETYDSSTRGEYSTELFGRKARELLTNHNPDQPLFLFLSMNAPHSPLHEAPCAGANYSDIEDPDRRSYAGMVTCMDEEVGKVVQAYKDVGFWENSIVIFMSDNGGDNRYGADNFPLRGIKAEFGEGGVRSPAFVTGGIIQSQGVITQEYVHVSDWYPTLLRLAGVADIDEDIYGMDLWHTISSGAPSSRSEIFLGTMTDYPNVTALHLPAPHGYFTAAYIQGNWKLLTGFLDVLVRGPSGTFIVAEGVECNMVLFNITADPSETTDLAPKYPEVVDAILRRMMELFESRTPEVYACADPRSDPALHGDVWGPWLEPGELLSDARKFYCLYTEAERASFRLQQRDNNVIEDTAGPETWTLAALTVGITSFILIVIIAATIVKCHSRKHDGYIILK